MISRTAFRTVAACGSTAALVLLSAAPALAATNFQLTTSPNVGGLHNELHSVAAVSPTSMVAVGEYFNGTWDRGLILTGNGTTWSASSAPIPIGSTHNGLNAVALANAKLGWAVGTYSKSKTSFDLIEKDTAGKWAVTSVPNPSGVSASELQGVSVGTASSVMAVGGNHPSRVPMRPASELFNGHAWKYVAVPNPGHVGTKSFTALLSSVAVVPKTSGKHFWAVGTYSNGADTMPFFDYWNGLTWKMHKLAASVQSVLKAPSPISSTVTSVTVLAANDAWAVGYYTVNHTKPTPPSNHTFAAHWNGSSWRMVKTPNRVSDATPNELVGVASRVVGSTKTVYAVGRYFAGPMDQTQVLMLTYVGSTPTWVKITSADHNTNLHNALEGVAFVPSGGAVSVGTYFTGVSDRTLVETCKSC
jgi:hypothetical protein